MMISANNTQAWTIIPKPLKRRIKAVSAVDPVLYSESRILRGLLEAHLHEIEEKVGLFGGPNQGSPSRRKRRAA